MITFVDTNILIDIFVMDPQFYQASAQALRQALQAGSVRASEVVWAEASSRFVNQPKFLAVMKELGIEFSPMDQSSAIFAGLLWQKYLNSNPPKKRDRIVADFLIGAHAQKHHCRLLTRDRGFFRDYFEGLEVLTPDSTHRPF